MATLPHLANTRRSAATKRLRALSKKTEHRVYQIVLSYTAKDPKRAARGDQWVSGA
jgi:hypothetical protein